MKLLFITQKLHGQDAFGVLWIKAFQERGYEVEVIVLEKKLEEAEHVLGKKGAVNFAVHSLGKETGAGKFSQIIRFWKLIRTLKYDRVFIHMSPVWGLLGAWYWIPKRTAVYLWYTHYKMQFGLFLLGFYGKRLFCATEQSMPQYPPTSSGQATAKKIVVGHGIDLSFWPKRENKCVDPYRLLGVFRISRSKRLELCIRALTLLPSAYIWQIYGIEAEPDYVAEMKALVRELGLESRVTFHGTAKLLDLPEIFSRHRLILNMASETIDKTMLEAMTCGCYPVTTARNAAAIGLRSYGSYGRQVGIPFAPAEDTPEAIAAFIQEYREDAPLQPDEMYRIVEERHSLKSLIGKMDRYIRAGI